MDGTPCGLGCDCFRHSERGRQRFAARHTDITLRTLIPREEDPTVNSTLRSYLAAFDEHLRALARNDHERAKATRLLMSILLTGARS